MQQGNKGSVVDTLGGYFREVMYSEDPQHNGLLLPDLTIECDTGAGYRKELQKLQWIWRNHGTPKADGTPADTYFMDYTDEDILWNDGGFSPGGGGAIKGTERNVPLGQPAYEIPAVLDQQKKAKDFTQAGVVGGVTKKFKTDVAKRQDGSRFIPRCFKIEILNFAWDESIQDPYRIRFNFRCKILRDMFWRVDDPEKTKLDGARDYMASLGDDWGSGSVAEKPAIKKDIPLNVGAQAAMVNRSAAGLPLAFQQQILPIMNNVLSMTGLGQNTVVQKVQALGQSVFGTNQPTYGSAERGESLSWGIPEEKPTVAGTNARIEQLLRSLPEIVAPQQQTSIQVGGWQVPVTPTIPDSIAGINLRDLRF